MLDSIILLEQFSIQKLRCKEVKQFYVNIVSGKASTEI